MKKLIVFALVLFSTVTFAQLQKGNILLGGSLGVSGSKSENLNPPSSIYTLKTNSFDISPRIGFFLSDRSVLGIGPGYSILKNIYNYSGNPTTTDKNSTFSIAPFYRYYFPIGEKFAFYLHGSAGLSFGRSNQHYTAYDPNTGQVLNADQKSDINGQYISVAPGITFFITPKWSIETSVLSIGYQNRKTKPKNSPSTTNSSFYFQYNVLGFGMNWYFGK